MPDVGTWKRAEIGLQRLRGQRRGICSPAIQTVDLLRSDLLEIRFREYGILQDLSRESNRGNEIGRCGFNCGAGTGESTVDTNPRIDFLHGVLNLLSRHG